MYGITCCYIYIYLCVMVCVGVCVCLHNNDIPVKFAFCCGDGLISLFMVLFLPVN